MRIELLFLFCFPSLVFSQTTIKIDGFFDDWSTNINTYIDDSLDSQGIELLDFSVCNDNEYLYVKIRLADEIDLTEPFYNPAEVMINIGINICTPIIKETINLNCSLRKN